MAPLDSLLGRSPLVVGDLIAAEVLQGIPDDREFKLVKLALEAFDHIDLVGYDIALKATEDYRSLRAMGITTFGRPLTR